MLSSTLAYCFLLLLLAIASKGAAPWDSVAGPYMGPESEVRKYWTPEQEAKLRLHPGVPYIPAAPGQLPPLRGAKGFAPASPSLPPASNLTRATPYAVNPATYPFNLIGRVNFASNGNNYICTGQFSAYYDTITLAGHCVYDLSSSTWSTNMRICLQYQSGSCPVSIAISSCRTFSAFANDGLSYYDQASCKTNSQSPNGYFGLIWGQTQLYVNYAGYGRNFGSNAVMYNSPGTATADPAQNSMLRVETTLGGGSSGAAYFSTLNQIAAINSLGAVGNPPYGWGAPVTSYTYDMITASHNR